MYRNRGDGAQGLLTPSSPSDSLIPCGPGCAGHVTGSNQTCDNPAYRRVEYAADFADNSYMTTVDGMDDGASITDSTEPQWEAQRLRNMESESLPYRSLTSKHVVESTDGTPEQEPGTNSVLSFVTNLLDSHLGKTTPIADGCPAVIL